MTFMFVSQDWEDGEQRRKRLVLEPTIYALEKYNGNRRKVAKYLGLSRRALTDRINAYPELTKYKKERTIDPISEQSIYNKPHLWRRKDGNDQI